MGKGGTNVLDEMEPTQENLFQEPESYENIIDEIGGMGSGTGDTVTGRIYRILGPSDAAIPGRPSTELVGKVDRLIDEDYVGKHYGSGKYKVRFRIKKKGEAAGIERNIVFSIGKEYDKYVLNSPSVVSPVGEVQNRGEATDRAAGGSIIDRFLDSINSEKIAALTMAVEAVKKIFAPPPQPDWIRLLEIMSRRDEPKPAFSDSVVLGAIESLKEKNAQPTIFEQIRDVERLKETLLKDNGKEKEKDDGEMNLLLKMAFDYLPQLLAKNNNNYQEVGRQAAEIPMIKNMVRDDPELAQNFFQTAKDRYGFDAAQNLARGFGIDMQFLPDDPTPAAIDGQGESVEGV